MQQSTILNKYQLMIVIINHGAGSKVMRIARQNGVKGGTIVYGKGTIKKPLLEWLDLTDVRKEIVLMVVEDKIVLKAIIALDHKFNFKKPNHGILFTLPLAVFLGDCHYEYQEFNESRGKQNMMYDAIFVIVDKGRGELAVEASSKAGAKGGTIINARGAGIHETSKIFNMEIEPEKEMVLILTEVNNTQKIVETIREDLELDKPGMGIIFVQHVAQAHGLHKV
jgi:nitrogen regulatory protein PII